MITLEFRRQPIEVGQANDCSGRHDCAMLGKAKLDAIV